MLLSAAIVLLGTQGICAAAAAVGGVALVAGMLPGPHRQTVWKWLAIWGISMMADGRDLRRSCRSSASPSTPSSPTAPT